MTSFWISKCSVENTWFHVHLYIQIGKNIEFILNIGNFGNDYDVTNTSYNDILAKLHDRKLNFLDGCLSLSTQMIYFL